MSGRTLHSVAFLTDLQSLLTRRARILLNQPVAQALMPAWDLCTSDSANDYDPRIRNALGIVAQVLDLDVGPMRSLAELPVSEDEVLERIYATGNTHSLASYLHEKTVLLFKNGNIEAIQVGPVSGDTALWAHLTGNKLFIGFDSRFELHGPWYQFHYVAGPEQSEIIFTKQEFLDRGLEFFTDFGRNSADYPWIAFPQYRLALGSRADVPPWIPLPTWR